MIIWFKNYTSDVKLHQNLGKLSFSMTFVGFYKTLIEISSKNNPKRSKMIKNDPKWFKNDLIYVIMYFKKWISDLKLHQNLVKYWFLVIFIDSYKTLIKIPFKNDQKRSKMIKNGPKWFKNDLIYVIMYFKKWISDLKLHQNLVKCRFLMIFIDFYKTLIKISSKNDPKRSKTVQNGPKCGFLIIFRSCARNVHWLPSEFLHKVHVRSFVTPP